MDDSSEKNRFVTVAKSSEGKQGAILRSLNETRESRAKAFDPQYYERLALDGELRQFVEKDLQVAREVLVDIGYSPSDAIKKMPKLEEIAFYNYKYGQFDVGGAVFHEGGGMEMVLEPYLLNPVNWYRARSIFVHELGHYPAKRVFAEGTQDGSPHRLVQLGFDKRKQILVQLGIRTKLEDRDGSYMAGILGEPLADIFGYYCTEKEGQSNPYQAPRYFRETAFLAAMLEQLSEIRNSDLFTEFAKLFKSYNDRDFTYFLSLRDDLANYFMLKENVDKKEALQKARTFISGLNSIHSEDGKDSVLTSIEGDPKRISVNHFIEGRQLSELAREGGFFDKYEKNATAIKGPGLVLKGASTKMQYRI